MFRKTYIVAIFLFSYTGCSEWFPGSADLLDTESSSTDSAGNIDSSSDAFDTAEEEVMPCNEAYYACNLPAGCILRPGYYIEDTFPGTARFVVQNTLADATLTISLSLLQVQSPGTETLMQVHTPNCDLNPNTHRFRTMDEGIDQTAGSDDTIEFAVTLHNRGEHLVEIYSDASATYRIAIQLKK